MAITPPINAVGTYVLTTPFTVVEGVDYTCQAIRSFNDCATRGLDVSTDVYIAKGLTEAEYLLDKTALVNLITLVAPGQKTIYVPDSYIESYPDVGQEPPVRLIVSIDLGIVTGTWDEQALLTALANLTSDTVGGSPVAQLHKTPVQGRALANDIEALDASRAISVANRTSDYSKHLKEAADNDLLRDKVSSLESMVRNAI